MRRAFKVVRQTGQGNSVVAGTSYTLSTAKQKAREALQPRDVSVIIRKATFNNSGQPIAIETVWRLPQKKKTKIPRRSRGQFAIGSLIIGAGVIVLIMLLALIYIIIPEPTDFIVGLGWIDEALVGIGALVASAFVLIKVVQKK